VDAQGSLLASTSAVLIPGVPAYDWHHGCGPTAAGMVLGYYDGRGYDALVPGSASTQTGAVNAMIATEGTASNYTDYCLPMDENTSSILPDKSEPPAGDEHADNCVADLMKTSQSAYGNRYGWSFLSHIGPAVTGYVSWLSNLGYVANYTNKWMTGAPALTWSNFRAEIDAGRPMILLVDTNADGSTDHFVTAIGYDTVGGVQKYACHSTWDRDVHWFNFAPMAPGQDWGIHSAVFLEMSGATVTETPTVTRTPTVTLTPSPTYTSTPNPTPTRTPSVPPTPAPLHLPLVFKPLPPMTLIAVSDATIIETLPDENFGTAVDMWTGLDLCEPDALGWTESLVRFNLGPIPMGHEVASAELRVYLVNSCDYEGKPETRTYAVHRAPSWWGETTVTWNNAPFPAETYGSADIQHAAWGWYTFDVTELVQAWEDGIYENYGLMIEHAESGEDPSRRGFSTREGEYPPELVVTFSR
jgi:hypothetical protein